MEINELIKNITPLYNKYKSNVNNISGTESLKIMWDIGLYLDKYIKKYKISPHKLFWSIYGRSEGKTNIVQKNYITREFQSRCYRIYKIFKNKEDIENTLPNLKKFNLFRESMPFFDNKKYILNNKDKNNLISLLNSDISNNLILNKIKNLQKNKIGIKNPRTQKLEDEEKNAIFFVNFYNYILDLINKKNYIFVYNELQKNKINNNIIDFLYKNTAAISQDNLIYFYININIENIDNNIWKNYLNFINKTILLKTKKNIRRFRRIIKPKKIFKLSEMIYSLKSEENYNSFIKSYGKL